MCGIYGVSLKHKANRSVALANFKILGLYNIERGKDSCGVCIDGKISKSLLEFDDFIRDNPLAASKGTVLLGHNRAGSAGYKKTIEEAHPFLINDNLVFTHNGTIRNTADLCKKYSVSEKDFNVDSKLLGTLLYTEGTKVLKDYKGYAALAYTKLDEEGTLYLYHGSSKNYKGGAAVEERPLYFLETKDGVYYSSLENSLKAIRTSDKEEVKNLNYNMIFKIVNGEFSMNDVEEVNREESNIDVYVAPRTTGYNRYTHHNYSYSYDLGINDYLPKSTAIRPPTSKLIPSVVQDKKKGYRETFPLKVVESAKDNFKLYGSDFIYYRCGRYWVAPNTLAEGSLLVKKGGILTTDSWDKSAELLYFFRGVLLKDMEAYKDIKSKQGDGNVFINDNWINNPKKYNFACEISKYSVYPVTNLADELNDSISEYYRYAWYKEDSKKNNHSFTPKFAGRNYIIKDNVLIEIKSSHASKEACYFSSIAEVNDQLIRIMKGVQGGNSSEETPFQNPGKEEEEYIKPFWPFDIMYDNIEELLKFWGDNEIEAVKRYIKYTFKRDFYIEASDKDINDSFDYSVNCAIKQGMSYNDFINKDISGDSKVLFKIYEEVLEEENSKTNNDPYLSFKNNVVEIDNIEEIKEEEAKEKEEKIYDEVESCIINLQDMQLNAFDLQIQEDSDFAQEIVKVLLVGIDNLLCSLAGPLTKYHKEDLLNKVKRIRESKNLKDGVLQG